MAKQMIEYVVFYRLENIGKNLISPVREMMLLTLIYLLCVYFLCSSVCRCLMLVWWYFWTFYLLFKLFFI